VLMQTPSCGRIERSDFFWETESIHQVNRIEPIRIANWNALPSASVLALRQLAH